ncbi:MAG: hypothetical protein ABIR06_05985 [Cyclobacteriaceae bacterium]
MRGVEQEWDDACPEESKGAVAQSPILGTTITLTDWSGEVMSPCLLITKKYLHNSMPARLLAGTAVYETRLPALRKSKGPALRKSKGTVVMRSFSSKEQLVQAIKDFEKVYNKKASPFEWTKTEVHQQRFKKKLNYAN